MPGCISAIPKRNLFVGRQEEKSAGFCDGKFSSWL